MAVTKFVHFNTVKELNEYINNPENRYVLDKYIYRVILHSDPVIDTLQVLDEYYGTEREFGDDKDGGIVYVILSGSLSDNQICHLDKAEYALSFNVNGERIDYIDEYGFVVVVIMSNNEFSSTYVIPSINLNNNDWDEVEELL